MKSSTFIDTVLTRFGAGLCAGDDVVKFHEHAARLLADSPELSKFQQQAVRFVTELHDNAKNVDAFLAGLQPAGIRRARS